MPARRKLRLRNPIKKERINNGEAIAGGLASSIGYTKELNNLTVVSKDIYGFFGGKGVIELDVQTGYAGGLCQPVFAYKDLIKIYLQSTILRQCVEAYQINIEGYGHTLEYIGPEGQQDSLASKNEHKRLSRVLDNLTTDGRTLQKHREDSRADLEILGARAFEVSQDLLGRTVIFNHVPTHTLRMTKREKTPITIEALNPLTGTTKLVKRRFRRFLQISEENEKVWFKELGDPRSINPSTGKEDNTLPVEARATSIYYEGLYTPGTPYGTPRWVGAIPALLGSREAEMVNLNFFRDNAIPAMAVLVSGGALTEESFNKIEQYIAGVRGQKSMNRIVVLEATTEGAETAAIDGSMPAPKVDIKPMLSERQHEGLFGNYIASAEEKARSAMRLPPVYIGSAKEYNRASAFASMLTADQQIFVPERTSWDTMFEHVVMSTHNPKYWRMRSLGPVLSDPQEVSKIVTTLSKEGGLTPNIAIKLANRYLDADIQTITDEWGDYPFAIILQALKGGAKIKGLEAFLSVIETVNEDEPDEPEEDEDVAASVKRGIYLMFDELSENLRKDVETIMDAAIIDYSDAVSNGGGQ